MTVTLSFVLLINLAHADDFDSVKNASYSGIVVNERDWFVYTSVVRSIYSTIHQSGWQLRTMAGMGRYKYKRQKIFYEVQKSVQEVMLGYQYVSKPLYLKLYVGPVRETQATIPLDPYNLMLGSHIGGKLQFESWVDWGQNGFATLDFTYETLQNDYVLSGKAGIKLYAGLQIGLEAGMSGNDNLSRYYGGVSARYNLSRTHALAVVAGGSQSDYEDDIGLYSKVTLDWKF